MKPNLCPACWRTNADNALSCSVCGAPLGAVDTVRLPLEASPRLASVGALWLDDLVGPDLSSDHDAEAGAAPLVLTLREIEPSAAPQSPQGQSAEPPPTLVRSDGATQSPLIDSSAAPVQHQTTDASQPAERRAAVRRDRRIGARAKPRAAPVASDVLVVCNTNVASDPLCGLLQAFGFTVHTTADTTEALARAVSPSLLASFVRAEVSDGNGGNGIDLCAQLRQASAPGAHERVPLLVLVAARLRPMDRVRAELAGCDDALAMPVTRGSVARLLDARGIRLPRDPRQGLQRRRPRAG